MTIRPKVKEANIFIYTYFPIQGRDRVPSVTGPNYSKHSKYNEEKFTKKRCYVYMLIKFTSWSIYLSRRGSLFNLMWRHSFPDFDLPNVTLSSWLPGRPKLMVQAKSSLDDFLHLHHRSM